MNPETMICNAEIPCSLLKTNTRVTYPDFLAFFILNQTQQQPGPLPGLALRYKGSTWASLCCHPRSISRKTDQKWSCRAGPSPGCPTSHPGPCSWVWKAEEMANVSGSLLMTWETWMTHLSPRCGLAWPSLVTWPFGEVTNA